jgi:uncharacterized protein
VPDSWFVLPLAVLIGVLLGALGSGGAILALPVLVYGAGLPARQAVAVSQLVVGLASLVGTLLQLRTRRIVWREVLLFAIVGIPATRVGTFVSMRVEPQLLMIGFAAVMVVAGIRMLSTVAEPDPTRRGRVWVSLLAGLLVGFLTGFLGVGGGFLLVPALIAFAGMDAKQATATSLPVIAVNTLSGAMQQSEQWLQVAGLAFSFLGATLVGTFFGLRLGRNASEAKLRQALGMILVSIGIVVGLLNVKG